MIKKSKSKEDNLVRESVLYAVVGASEKRLGDRIDKLEEKLDKRFDVVMEHIDGLAKGFKKFDEEHTIHTAKLADHGDRIEVLEKTVASVV